MRVSMSERRITETDTILAKIPTGVRRELNDFGLSDRSTVLADLGGELLVEAWER